MVQALSTRSVQDLQGERVQLEHRIQKAETELELLHQEKRCLEVQMEQRVLWWLKMIAAGGMVQWVSFYHMIF